MTDTELERGGVAPDNRWSTAIAGGEEFHTGLAVVVRFDQRDVAVTPLATEGGDGGIIKGDLSQVAGGEVEVCDGRGSRGGQRSENKARVLVRGRAAAESVAVDAAVPAFASGVGCP